MNSTPQKSIRTSLANDFRAMGVAAGDTIMLHASFRSLGPVEGGPDAVIDGLLDAVAPNGGVVMFVSWEHTTYDAFAGSGLTKTDRAEWLAFDPATAPVHPRYGGAIGACLALRPGAVRSQNPDRSLLGIGSATSCLENHVLNHGFGIGSSLEALFLRGTKTLNLGAPLGTETILHYAEYIAEVPDKRFVTYDLFSV